MRGEVFSHLMFDIYFTVESLIFFFSYLYCLMWSFRVPVITQQFLVLVIWWSIILNTPNFSSSGFLPPSAPTSPQEINGLQYLPHANSFQNLLTPSCSVAYLHIQVKPIKSTATLFPRQIFSKSRIQLKFLQQIDLIQLLHPFPLHKLSPNTSALGADSALNEIKWFPTGNFS